MKGIGDRNHCIVFYSFLLTTKPLKGSVGFCLTVDKFLSVYYNWGLHFKSWQAVEYTGYLGFHKLSLFSNHLKS